MDEDEVNISLFAGKTISNIERIKHNNGVWLDIDFIDGSSLSVKLSDPKSEEFLRVVEEWMKRNK